MRRFIFFVFKFPIKRLFGLDTLYKGKPFCEGQLKSNQFLGKLDTLYKGNPFNNINL